MIMSCTRRFLGAMLHMRMFRIRQRDMPFRATFGFRLKNPNAKDRTMIAFGIGAIELNRREEVFVRSFNVRDRREFDNLYRQLDQGECWDCGHISNCKNILAWQR